MKKYVLAIDQGTTSSRAVLFDKRGEIADSAQLEYKQIYPRPGWVEHDPEDIFSSVVTTLKSVLAECDADEISSIGITNQRETTIVWDKKTGEPVYNAIVWQCRRTAEYIDSLKAGGFDQLIYDKTGLALDAYFSASKIKWILDNVDGARERAEKGELMFGTVDTFLLFRLTGGKVHATDYTNAARTMLFNVHTKEWDDVLCALFGIPKSMLPEVFPSGHEYGYTDKKVVGAALPVCSLVGDQQGALYGQNCWKAGDVKNTYGTGCFLLMNTGSRAVNSKRGLITTLGACLDGETPDYVLEGSVFVGGAVVQWLRDELKLISSARETEEIAQSVKDTEGVYIVPAFVGLGAPYWDSKARGLICGLTRGAGRAHIVRAALESIAYQTFDVLHAMERDLGRKVEVLKVDGGASANNFLLQFQADISGAKVVRPAVVETTAMGAAYLAGLTSGLWNGKDEIIMSKATTQFVPIMPESEREERVAGWNEAIFRARSK